MAERGHIVCHIVIHGAGGGARHQTIAWLSGGFRLGDGWPLLEIFRGCFQEGLFNPG